MWGIIIHTCIADKVETSSEAAKRAAESVFAKVAMAKEILCDPVKRKQYDEGGINGVTATNADANAGSKPKAFGCHVDRSRSGDVHIMMDDAQGAMMALLKVVRFSCDEQGTWRLDSQTQVCPLDWRVAAVKTGPLDLCAITVFGVNTAGVGPATTFYRFGLDVNANDINGLLAVAVTAIKGGCLFGDVCHSSFFPQTPKFWTHCCIFLRLLLVPAWIPTWCPRFTCTISR